MNFNQIYKQVVKSLKTSSSTFTDVEVSEFLNKGLDEAHRFCPNPTCNKKLKNWHGVKIHMAKIHGWSTKNLVSKALNEL